MKWFGLFVSLLLIYAIVIPGFWTFIVSGKTGISDSGNEMKISAVVPCSAWSLYCYEGIWQKDDTKIDLPYGLTVSGNNFHGYCHINKMEVE